MATHAAEDALTHHLQFGPIRRPQPGDLKSEFARVAGEMISIETRDGINFAGYLARPQTQQGLGVVLIHENFGLTRWIRSIADEFAARGYVVLAPDLFWRFEPFFTAEPGNNADIQRALKLVERFNFDLGVEDITAAISALKSIPECNGKIGAAGFCLGGTLSYLTAARRQIDAAVAYYGAHIHKFVNEGRHLDCPMVFHLADKDETHTEEDRNRIFAALIGMPHVSIYTYDTGHSFANSDCMAGYDHAAAEQAYLRSFAIFDALNG